MTKDWLSHPWIERFLPDHLRPVDEHIFSDPYGLVIIQETEAALERLILHGEQIKGAQTFKKSGKTFQFRLKVNQKRMRLLSYDTAQSEAAIKKRIVVEYLRKAYVPKSSQKRFKEAHVQYIKNGKTFVRSIRRSSLFQSLFVKLEQLDDALLGKLIQPSAAARFYSQSPSEKEDSPADTKELMNLLQPLEDAFQSEWGSLGNVIRNRLERLLVETRQAASIYDDLDIEDKYNLKRMLQKDIPDLIETYLLLPQKEKESRTEQVYEALTKMEVRLRSVKEATEQNNVEKIEQLLRLTDKRYSTQNKKGR